MFLAACLKILNPTDSENNFSLDFDWVTLTMVAFESKRGGFTV